MSNGVSKSPPSPLTRLENKGLLFWITAGCLLVACVGAADALTGSELSFSLFYLIPVILVTWFSGRNAGLAISGVGIAVWFAANTLDGQHDSHPMIPYWNAAVRMGFFAAVTLLLPALKALEREKEIARTDALTGVANRRSFIELAGAELVRSQRYDHPCTVAYFDLDDFKIVNDRSGHAIGDRVLCAIVNRAKGVLRKTDTIARLGGDTFILLFPETGSEDAQVLVPKIQSALLDEMRRNGWPVTFSIGALTCRDGSISSGELMRRADELMYTIKSSGKNGVAYAQCAGEPGNEHRRPTARPVS